MKRLRMAAVAVVAAVAMAMLAGSGTASATVLYNNIEDLPAGSEVSASLKTGSSMLLKAGFANITCSESTFSGLTENTGGSSSTVRGRVSALSIGFCNATVMVGSTFDVIKGVGDYGEFEVHHILGTGNGTLTGRAIEITVSLAGTHCVYRPLNSIDLGTITAGNPATIHINAKLPKSSGGFLCANPAEWTATYTVTTPSTLTVSAS